MWSRVLSLCCLIWCLGLPQLARGAEPAVKETEWLSQSQMGALFQQAVDNRFMMFKVVGQKRDDDSIVYKGFMRPFPKNLDKFYTYWAMGDAAYRARHQGFLDQGYEEIWHQSFTDAGGQTVHQAVWLRLLKQPARPAAPATKGPAERVNL